MKKSICFILGVVVGVILTFFFAIVYNAVSGSKAGADGLELFETVGDVMPSTTYEVLQAFPDGTALAYECSGPYDIHTGLTVLLIAPQGKQYYDDQKVTAPKGMIFRQVGLYRYESKLGSNTVPAISLHKK